MSMEYYVSRWLIVIVSRKRYLKLVLHGANSLNQLRNSIAECVRRRGIGCCLNLEDKVVIQGMRHLVTGKEHLGILQQLPSIVARFFRFPRYNMTWGVIWRGWSLLVYVGM